MGQEGRAPLHLEVSVDDGSLALVQASHGLTRVTEDVEDLSLTEAHVQPLVHLLHHLTCCRVRGEGQRQGSTPVMDPGWDTSMFV